MPERVCLKKRMEQSSNVLPVDFDGVFRFTNPTEEDFTGFWNKKGYTYPAMSTSLMVIMDATPLEIQNIRKKFAKELAEREFFKSAKAKEMTATERVNNAPAFGSIHSARSYSDSDLKDYIQKCLTPLPIAQATIADMPTSKVEENLSRDEEGELRTTVVDKKTSLKQKALKS